MKNKIFSKLLPAAFLLFGAFVASQQAAAQTVFNCLPTCTENDGRFLTIAGSGLSTLTDQQIDIQLELPGTTTGFSLGVFDGDTGGTDSGGAAHWDLGTDDLTFQLYANPTDDDANNVLVATFSGSTLLDNAWTEIPFTHDPHALTPSGDYKYHLHVVLSDPTKVVISNFKVRILPDAIISIIREPFAFEAAIHSLADAQIVFPSFPDLTPTTYDGSFNFYAIAPTSQTSFTLWDGDLDRGKYDGTDLDDDDPNTPNNVLPDWAVPSTVFEGAQPVNAVNPPDDVNPAGLGVYVVRPPSVEYSVTTPAGEVATNQNPSGNQEWENFTITTAPEPIDPTVADKHVASLPAGVYTVALKGMDMQNLNAWRMDSAICVDSTGNACKPRCPEAPCDGKVTTLTLRYNGATAQDIEVYQKGVSAPLYAGTVNPGDSFTVTGQDDNGTLGSTVKIYTVSDSGSCATSGDSSTYGGKKHGHGGYFTSGYGGKKGGHGGYSTTGYGGKKKGGYTTTDYQTSCKTLVATFNTSCSDPIGPGLADGDFEVISGESSNGGPLPAMICTNNTPPSGGEGCTPGYWKQSQHAGSWMVYNPDDSFDQIFGVDAPGDKTLLETLGTGGGGADALGRHAVAALLNSVNPDVSFEYTAAEVISMVQDAYSTGDYETTKNLLADQNEAGCPLARSCDTGTKSGKSGYSGHH